MSLRWGGGGGGGSGKDAIDELVQVTTITEMKDNQRLALIKDVAGTNVYEEKKGESEKILNDSLRKMDEIKNVKYFLSARRLILMVTDLVLLIGVCDL